jgi:hypothetical protein
MNWRIEAGERDYDKFKRSEAWRNWCETHLDYPHPSRWEVLEEMTACINAMTHSGQAELEYVLEYVEMMQGEESRLSRIAKS